MIKSRDKSKMFCLGCGKEMMVRNDYIKKHQGLCGTCMLKKRWRNKEFYNKCSNAKKGHLSNSRLPYGEGSFNKFYGGYLYSAGERGLEFALTKEQFRALSKQNCYYCGIEPLQINDEKNKDKYNGVWLHNGIDRKDDSIGYTIDNCVASCKVCNYMKQGLNEIEFMKQVSKIYKHFQINSLGSTEELVK